MNTEIFWSIISNYNQGTIILQGILVSCLILSIVCAKKKQFYWLPKAVYGCICIYMAIVFFLLYGTEPIQHYFAFPLYLILGGTFFYETIKRKEETLNKFSKLQVVLVLFIAIYPLSSIIQGKEFPEMLTYIMPCPVVCIGIVVWLSYARRNLLSLALLTIWGLTGIKAFLFHAYEDLILFGMGIIALIILVKELYIRLSSKSKKHS